MDMKRRDCAGSLSNESVTDGLVGSMSSHPNDVPEMPPSKYHLYYKMDYPQRSLTIIFNFEQWDNSDNTDNEHPNVYLPRREVNQIWEEFQADKCPTLAGKPKIFIIQACRGIKVDNGTRVYGDHGFTPSPNTNNDGTDSGGFSYVTPNAADTFIAFSCPPGQVSYRNRTNGTWFIQAVCKVLTEEADNADLQTLFTHVAREVALNNESSSNDATKDKKVQVSSSTSTLIRIVKFGRKRRARGVDKTVEGAEIVLGNNKHRLPPPSSEDVFNLTNNFAHHGRDPGPEFENSLLTNPVD
ncbi:unnamed protein product [Allacma fusca]|uniref:Uncharacterized protein n=1 Tax=Allacma fusca TaxID=39272 RepID=A0A8J2KLS4_9HEXA|nr:unnamed protein product [Allacma fusca]